MERHSSIDKELGEKTSHWLAEDAVQAYREYIQVNHRCPDNFGPLLEQLQSVFQGRNIVQIIPNEIEGFLFSRWGHLQKSTIKKRKEQLSQFFNFCIRELRRKGAPDFHNPVKLVQEIKAPPKTREGFLPVEKIQELLDTCKDIKHWLMFSIMATAGLRVGELLELTPNDINGRILTLREPKSGKDKEYAVIPQLVADRLKEYSKYFHPDKSIFPGKTNWVNKLLAARTTKLRLEHLSSDDLQRWAAMFWTIRKDISMMIFVLRRSSFKKWTNKGVLDFLAMSYITPLTVKEAMERQEEVMAKELGLR